MKNLFLILLFTCTICNAQYRNTRQNGVLARTEEYETNSPGNMIANTILLAYYKDHTAMGFAYPSVEFWNFTSIRNDGTPTSIAWFDSNGFLKRSPLPSETDPIWSSQKSNYYDKIETDGRYLQSFTETDPTVPASVKAITVSNINNWNTVFGWGNHSAAGYLLTSLATSTYQPLLGFVAVPNTRTINGYNLNTNLTLTKGDIMLSNVDNTSDINKPVSTATQTALDTKVVATRTINGQVLSSNVTLTKSDVGLGNADNTNDLSKPISTLTQTALNGKLSVEVDGSITNELQTLSITGNIISISSGNNITIPIVTDYVNTVSTTGTTGNAIFYLTSDKTSTGTALYTTLNYVSPIINDSTLNYTYGWTYNSTTKALTVNAKSAAGVNVSLVGLTLLGAPVNVASGTNIQLLVKGI